MKKLWSILLLMIGMLICFAGCEQPKEQIENKNGIHVSNALNADGLFACRDGYIYFSDRTNIFEYDIVSEKTVILGRMSGYGDALFVTEDRVWYVVGGSDGLQYITRDGKNRGSSYREAGKMESYFCCDGKDAYFVRYVTETEKFSLFHMDWETGITTVLSGDHNVYTYSVDANNIYIVEQVEPHEDFEVLVSDRKKIDFRKIDLSFEPVVTCPTAEGVYISNLGKGGLSYIYRDEKTTELPFSTGPYYDVVGKNIIYKNRSSYSRTKSRGCRPLELYDLETGEKRVFNDSVWKFALLEERYVCYWWADDVHQKWYYYDLQTGENKLMYEIEDSMIQYGYGID